MNGDSLKITHTYMNTFEYKPKNNMKNNKRFDWIHHLNNSGENQGENIQVIIIYCFAFKY